MASSLFVLDEREENSSKGRDKREAAAPATHARRSPHALRSCTDGLQQALFTLANRELTDTISQVFRDYF